MGYLQRTLGGFGLLLALIGDAYHVVQAQQAYDDFTWIKNFAAVGDSYTAGIGAGRLLDSTCSRYDGSYAAMMARQFTALKNFYNLGCSGAQSSDILAQIETLPDNLDLAVMTAGGNDLCLSAILIQCILSNVATQAGCNSAIQLAQDGLDTFFQSNIEQLIVELASKVNSNGIVVVMSYAQFFDATTSACTTEDWTLFGTTSLSLSTSLRATLNGLVVQVNAALQNAVRNVQQSSTAKITFANWDPWPALVSGRFCEQGQNPDPAWGSGSTNMLQFFKLNTRRAMDPYLGLFLRRDLSDGYQAMEDPFFQWSYESTSYPPLSSRGITPANCPKTSNFVPDGIGKLFHPTLWGHASMMTYALDAVRNVRATELGLTPPACVTMDMQCNSPASFTDASASAYKPYATYAALLNQVTPFCSMVQQAISKGQGSTPFSWNYVYYGGTPDQAQFKVQFDKSVSPGSYWSTTDCVKYFEDILLQCWSNNSPASNPMQWVFGGSYVVGSWTYSIAPQSMTRLWPLPTAPSASATGMINAQHGEVTYLLQGSGWASWDHGQSSLLANFTYCNGKQAPIQWAFQYMDASSNGYEWEAFLQTGTASYLVCMTSGQVDYFAGGPPTTQVSWTSELPSWSLICPGVSTSSLTCGGSCCGHIVCGAWCNANCGGVTC